MLKFLIILAPITIQNIQEIFLGRLIEVTIVDSSRLEVIYYALTQPPYPLTN